MKLWIELGIVVSMCVALTACDPRGTPQEPKTSGHIATLPALAVQH